MDAAIDIQVIPVHQREDPLSHNIVAVVSVYCPDVRGEQGRLHVRCDSRGFRRALGKLKAQREGVFICEGCQQGIVAAL